LSLLTPELLATRNEPREFLNTALNLINCPVAQAPSYPSDEHHFGSVMLNRFPNASDYGLYAVKLVFGQRAGPGPAQAPECIVINQPQRGIAKLHQGHIVMAGAAGNF
jgi:hypothetical protein